MPGTMRSVRIDEKPSRKQWRVADSFIEKDVAGLDHDSFVTRGIRKTSGVGALGTINPVVGASGSACPGAGRKKSRQDLIEQSRALEQHAVDRLQV